MTEEAKSVRVQPIPEECNAETFCKRMELFKVVMLAKGNRVALKNNPMLPVSECDVNDIADTETDYKKKHKAVEKNMSMIMYLAILCLDSIRAKTALEKSKTDEWPTGIAYKAIEYLEAAFIAEDVTAKKLSNTLDLIEYKDEKVKPKMFISQVQRVKNLNKEIKKKEERVGDKEFVEHVINNAPKVYVTSLVEAREKSAGTYELDDAQKTMYKILKPLYGKDEKVMALQDIEDEHDTEVALFEGVCYGCDEVEKPKEKGRYHLDLAVCKVPTKLKFKSPNPNWLMIVDEYSGLKTTRFYPTKKAMVEDVCELFQQLKSLGRVVKYVRCDGAGENLLLEQRAKSKDWKLGIVFEYTGRNTPQRNSLVEVGFPTISGRARAMLSAANLPLKVQYKVFNESLATATLYDGLKVVVVNNKAKTRFQHSIGTIP